MREISLPIFYEAALPPQDSDFDEAHEIRQIAGRIVSAASAVEAVMVDVIARSLLHDVKEHREIVIGSILKSDWCTFAAKRKLLNLSINEYDLLDGSDRHELEKLLSRVGKYRNAFAHGTLLHNFTHHEVRHFDGQPQRTKLNDEYFSELEGVFQKAWEYLQQMQSKVRPRAA